MGRKPFLIPRTVTSETRYFRNDQHTINTITAYKLLTSQTGVSRYVTINAGGSNNTRVGMVPIIRHIDGSYVGIDGYTVKAIVTRTSNGIGIQSATWGCPETSLSITDAIEVRVYLDAGGGWIHKVTFITDQLGATQLDAATWTIHYYTKRIYIGSPFFLTYCEFHHGYPPPNSKIENFTHSV